jgi:uncharacterized protein YndB with AHSA1/START domain
VEIRMLRLLLVSVIAALGSGLTDAAEVAPNGFLVRHERIIGAPAARVYDALIGQVGSWWNPQHTYSRDSKNLSIEPRPGGCFCERLQSGGVEHMRVVHLKPHEMVRLAGGLGPLQAFGVTGSMTWRLAPSEGGSKLELIYSVGGYITGGFESIAPAVERVLGEQADRLKRFVETGTPSEAK